MNILHTLHSTRTQIQTVILHQKPEKMSKNYFRITFGLDLMCNKAFKVRNLCGGGISNYMLFSIDVMHV